MYAHSRRKLHEHKRDLTKVFACVFSEPAIISLNDAGSACCCANAQTANYNSARHRVTVNPRATKVNLSAHRTEFMTIPNAHASALDAGVREGEKSEIATASPREISVAPLAVAGRPSYADRIIDLLIRYMPNPNGGPARVVRLPGECAAHNVYSHESASDEQRSLFCTRARVHALPRGIPLLENSIPRRETSRSITATGRLYFSEEGKVSLARSPIPLVRGNKGWLTWPV